MATFLKIIHYFLFHSWQMKDIQSLLYQTCSLYPKQEESKPFKGTLKYLVTQSSQFPVVLIHFTPRAAPGTNLSFFCHSLSFLEDI